MFTYQDFRISLWIRIPVLISLLLWGYLLALDLASLHLPLNARIPLVFFVLLFLVSSTYYWRVRYRLSEQGITYIGVMHRSFISWTEIQEIHPPEIPFSGLRVETAVREMLINGFVSGTKQIFDRIEKEIRLSNRNRLPVNVHKQLRY